MCNEFFKNHNVIANIFINTEIFCTNVFHDRKKISLNTHDAKEVLIFILMSISSTETAMKENI